MRIGNDTLIDSAQSLGADLELEPIYLGHIVNYSIQLVFTGAPVGTFKLQMSNDKGVEDRTTGGWNSSGVTNWTDISGSNQSILAAGDHAWNVINAGYRWVRVVYERTSGTGSLTVAKFNVKGV